MPTTKTTSAGLLMYRHNKEKVLEVFLVHPGGPFHAKKDSWGIPKGLVNEGEDLFTTAKREFQEETSFKATSEKFMELTPAVRPDKIVHAWAFEGDCDPSQLKSNTCFIEWPPRSGKQMEIPEIDRGAFFTLKEARVKLYKYLVPLVEELAQKLT